MNRQSWRRVTLTQVRTEDRHAFISTDYSTYRRYPVMVRETFSEPGIVRLRNENFVRVEMYQQSNLDPALQATHLGP